jgi:16S rRNA (guanine1207-N2)-methyltransferase
VIDSVRALLANADAMGRGPVVLFDMPFDPEIEAIFESSPDFRFSQADRSHPNSPAPWVPASAPSSVAIVVAPRSRKRLACLLQMAAATLAPGGQLVLIASNTGARGAISELGDLGPVEKLAPKAHHRVAQVIIDLPPRFELADWRTSETIETPAGALALVWYPGVFAEGHLDPASELLLSNLPAATGNALDLGTGCGVLLAALAQAGNRVWGSEVDHFARQATNETMSANGLVIEELTADAIPAGPEDGFDLIVTNPPFHAGRKTTTATAVDLITQGFLRLSAEGQMLIVANRFLPYDRTLSQLGSFEVVTEDSRYRIWRAWRAR